MTGRSWPAIPPPTAFSTTPIEACNTPARTMSSDWSSAKAPSPCGSGRASVEDEARKRIFYDLPEATPPRRRRRADRPRQDGGRGVRPLERPASYLALPLEPTGWGARTLGVATASRLKKLTASGPRAGTHSNSALAIAVAAGQLLRDQYDQGHLSDKRWSSGSTLLERAECATVRAIPSCRRLHIPCEDVEGARQRC